MNLSVRARITLVCGVLLGAMALTTGLGMWQLADSKQRADQISAVNQTAARLSAQLRTDISKASRATRDLLLAHGDDHRKVAGDAIDQYMRERDERRRQLRAIGDPAIAGKLDELDTALHGADELDKQVRELAGKASNEHATAMIEGAGHKQSDALQDAMRKLDAELARRPLTAETVALRADLWQSLHDVAVVVSIDQTLAATVEETAVDAALADYTRRQSELGKRLASMEHAAQSPDERRAMSAVRVEYDKFHDVLDRASVFGHESADGKAVILAETKGAEMTVRIGKITDDIIAAEIAATETALAAADHESGRARTVMITVFVLALAFGSVLAFFTIRYIGSSLKSAMGLAGSVAGGDLTHTVEVTRHDEIGAMVTALNDMVGNLRRVARDVTAAATSVATGAEELTATAGQVAEGSSQQGAATEETTAAMEEMGASVQQNADNAQQTDRLASKASADAQISGQAVTQTLSAMKNIAEKISIIEEIARKTDLLALNAAVEAARAGDHGRGFAVVASEVRKLAERSATAAGEISQLARSGVSLAENAGEMLTQLVPDIRKTAELIQEVSAASREQSTGIEQSNKALQDLDRVTQQNAAAAEEMAATAGELSSQAHHLQTAVGFFRLEAGARAAGGAPIPAARPASNGKPRKPAAKRSANANGTPAGGHRALRNGPAVTTGALMLEPRHGVDLDLSGPDDDGMFDRPEGSR
jgi:methyl-accepting chemotaxis protein